MSDSTQGLINWVRESCAPLQHWYPLIGSVATLLAGFCKGPLRFALLAIAVVAFLVVVADVAESLLEKESGYASAQGPPTIVPVTPLQIVIASLLACIYTFMLAGGLRLVFFSSGLGFFVMLPCIFLLAYLAAWRNVRLWYKQAIDYEQALNEEEQAHDLHLPPGPMQ